MKKAVTLLLSMAMAISIFSQTADFENFNLSTDEYLNGSDGNGGFQSGLFFFPNQFTDGGSYTFWDGWAISSMTDITTPGLNNQYSCIAGIGASNSSRYAVSYVVNESIVRMPSMAWTFPYSIEINNSTYAYLSMLEGDSQAKKFGGADGNDPDFFLLTIKGYAAGILTEDSIDFYLADYRFDDNSMDYIVKDWAEIDLMPLGTVDSLSFSLTSSDNNNFGMLTPAYFCADNLILGIVEGINDHLGDVDIKIFPNPVVEELSIDWKEPLNGALFIYSNNGQLIKKCPLLAGLQTIDVRAMPLGTYLLKIQTEKGWICKRFVKG